MTNAPSSPGIRFPPPLVFVAGLAAAWALDRRVEFLIAGAGAGVVQVSLGLAAIAGGLGLMAWGLLTFLRVRTGIYPTRSASELVEAGPFRFSRNPMYVGLASAYVGASLAANRAWPLVLLPLVWLALSGFIVRREERYLRAAFGAAYDDYCRRVRRWL